MNQATLFEILMAEFFGLLTGLILGLHCNRYNKPQDITSIKIIGGQVSILALYMYIRRAMGGPNLFKRICDRKGTVELLILKHLLAIVFGQVLLEIKYYIDVVKKN